MIKLREKLKGETNSQRNSETLVYAEIKKRREPTHRVMFTQKTEQLESDRQLQNLTIVPNISAISILTRPVKKMSSRMREQGKNDFQVIMNPQTNGYLVKKYKKFLQRRQEKSQTKSANRSTIISEQNKTISFDIFNNESHMTCDTCCRMSKKNTIDEGIFYRNAKERIIRLMELKKVQEIEDEELTDHIKSRCLKTERSKRGVPTALKMTELQEQPWDKSWKKSLSLELKRYRTRVLIKSKKSQRNQFDLELT